MFGIVQIHKVDEDSEFQVPQLSFSLVFLRRLNSAKHDSKPPNHIRTKTADTFSKLTGLIKTGYKIFGSKL